jgi:hypothetical protein
MTERRLTYIIVSYKYSDEKRKKKLGRDHENVLFKLDLKNSLNVSYTHLCFIIYHMHKEQILK